MHTADSLAVTLLMFERLALSPNNLETQIRGRDKPRRREEPANKEERQQTGRGGDK